MSLTVSSGVDGAQVPGITAEAYLPDQLIAGRFPLVTDTVTIVSGSGVVKRGTVLGKITASGKFTTCLNAASDGSQTPSVILADTVDATSADVSAGVYLAGEFNTNAMTFGTGTTIANSKDTLRDSNIYLKSAVSAADPS